MYIVRSWLSKKAHGNVHNWIVESGIVWIDGGVLAFGQQGSCPHIVPMRETQKHLQSHRNLFESFRP